VFEKKNAETLPKHWPYDYTIDLVKGTQPPFKPIYNLSQDELIILCEYINENFEKGFIQHSKFLVGAPITFVKKAASSECVSITMGLINSLSKINTLWFWSQSYSTSLVMVRCTPRLIYVEHTTWCAFQKVMNEKQHLEPIMTILNMLWCHLALLTRSLFFNIWWIMSFVSFWMIHGLLHWWHFHFLRKHGGPWLPCTFGLEKL